MNLNPRCYRDDEDAWRIRAFLRETLMRNGYRKQNWTPLRYDYWHHFINPDLNQVSPQESVYLWESPRGELAAMLNLDRRSGEAYLHLQPDLRRVELEEEMIRLAEERMPQLRSGETRRLTIWAQQGDSMREGLLTRLGYSRLDEPEYQRCLRLDQTLPSAPVPDGFHLRALGEGAEVLERAYASGLAFHPDNIQIAVENRRDIRWYRHIQGCPQYRRDFDLVAVTEQGHVAAFATIWFDEVTRVGEFEPVGTVPAYQRRGLGKALMCEGLRRLKQIGAVMAFVDSYSVPAGALYASAGFDQFFLAEPWEKVWK